MGGFERYMSRPMVLELTQSEPRCMTANAVAQEIEALVREHSRLVFRIAYSVVRNHADAEDVVQEVFLRVAKHGGAGITDPKAWISRIAWRASVDRFRRLGRPDQEEFDERLHAPQVAPPGTEQGAISRQTLQLLDRMIAAQALVHRATLITFNPDDFADVPNLSLLAW